MHAIQKIKTKPRKCGVGGSCFAEREKGKEKKKKETCKERDKTQPRGGQARAVARGRGLLLLSAGTTQPLTSHHGPAHPAQPVFARSVTPAPPRAPFPSPAALGH